MITENGFIFLASPSHDSVVEWLKKKGFVDCISVWYNDWGFGSCVAKDYKKLTLSQWRILKSLDDHGLILMRYDSILSAQMKEEKIMDERMLTCKDFGIPEEPVFTHEIKESEIPKSPMGFKKQDSGAAVDQKHYQTAEKEPIEVMQMYFTPQEMYGFCKGNAVKYILRSRFKGHELQDMEKALQYTKWAVDVLKGEKIDPRK